MERNPIADEELATLIAGDKDASECLDDFGVAITDEGRWPDPQKSLEAFSAKFPETIFVLRGESGSSEIWDEYYLSGKLVHEESFDGLPTVDLDSLSKSQPATTGDSLAVTAWVFVYDDTAGTKATVHLSEVEAYAAMIGTEQRALPFNEEERSKAHALLTTGDFTALEQYVQSLRPDTKPSHFIVECEVPVWQAPKPAETRKENENYPVSYWQEEVAAGNTQRGYQDWVAAMQEQSQDDEDSAWDMPSTI
jgi:hypothetical protein